MGKSLRVIIFILVAVSIVPKTGHENKTFSGFIIQARKRKIPEELRKKSFSSGHAYGIPNDALYSRRTGKVLVRMHGHRNTKVYGNRFQQSLNTKTSFDCHLSFDILKVAKIGYVRRFQGKKRVQVHCCLTLPVIPPLYKSPWIYDRSIIDLR